MALYCIISEIQRDIGSSVVIMALYCIISEIQRDIGQKSRFFHTPHSTFSLGVLCRNIAITFGTEKNYNSVSQSVSGTLDRPRVVAPSKTCGNVRSSRRRWRWAQCRPRSAAPTFGRVVLAGSSTPAWCPVYRLHECPQPGVVRSGLVSLPVVAARDQKWRVASDKSGLLSVLRQFG